MSKKRKQHPPEFKGKVALSALRNEENISELATRFGIHPTIINSWKRVLLGGASDIFDKGLKSRQDIESQIDELYYQIGRLRVERDFLSKNNMRIKNPEKLLKG